MIRYTRARPEDAAALAEVSGRAFDDDVHYGAPGPGGPSGYRSDAWQATMMHRADYYAIWDDQRIIGGMIVFAREPRHYELGRIFIEPSYQNQGIGAAALAWLEARYPLAKRWTLGTPRWNLRTQHFYAKMGYVCVGSEGPDGLRYEKVIATPAPGAAAP